MLWIYFLARKAVCQRVGERFTSRVPDLEDTGFQSRHGHRQQAIPVATELEYSSAARLEPRF